MAPRVLDTDLRRTPVERTDRRRACSAWLAAVRQPIFFTHLLYDTHQQERQHPVHHPPRRDETEAKLDLSERVLTNTHLSLWEMLSRTAGRFPERTAIHTEHESISYAELLARSSSCADKLRQKGITRGTRVAFLMHAVPEWAVLHYALARLGAVAVPVSLAFEQAEISHVISSTQPRMFFTIDRYRGRDHELRVRTAVELAANGTGHSSTPAVPEVVVVPLDEVGEVEKSAVDTQYYFEADPSFDGGQLAEVPVPRASDSAYVIFTSGSTAAPKPALCSNAAFLGSATGFGEALGVRETDIFLAMLPPFHTGGVSVGLTMPHLVGASTYLLGMFTPESALAAIRKTGCTATVGFDAMYSKIIELDEFDSAAVSSLRRSVVAATPSFIESLRKVWPLDVVATTYGSTESGSLASITPAWQTEISSNVRANGQVLPGVDLKIVDPRSGTTCPTGVRGEIAFRGWGRVIEYLGRPDETAAAIDPDGFFHSGDIGYIDDLGRLHFEGRYKNMIKTGGENVSEREVEIFLETFVEAITFAQVVGAPDEKWGELVVAFVSVDRDVDPADLRRSALGNIAKYKVPRHFFTLSPDEFPVLANGRPDKSQLRSLAVTLISDAKGDK